MPRPYPRPENIPIKKVVSKLSGGLNASVPPGELKSTELSATLNLQFFDGILRSDTGYTPFLQSVVGIPMAVFQFIQTSGVLQNVLMTTTRFYIENTVVLEWQYVSDGFNQSLTSSTAAGSAVFHFAATAGLNPGDPVGVTLDNSSQLRSTIHSVDSGTQVTLNDAVPTGRTANIGASFLRTPVLNGSVDIQPSGVTWPALNWLIVTNGIDHVKFFDGQNLEDIAGLTTIGVNTAYLIVVFHSFVILGFTIEGGTKYPYRYRWCNLGDPTTWNGTTSGFNDLLDSEDFIVALEPLGPWVIIYREASIMRVSYIGDPSQLFFNEYTVQGVGVFSGTSIANVQSSHVFLGNEGIFRYAGGYDIESVGDNIFDLYFGPNGSFSESMSTRTFALYIAELDEVWFFVVTGVNTYADTLLRYDQGDESWWVVQFPNKFIGFGFLEETVSSTWQSLTNTWAQAVWTWQSRSHTLQAPITMLCDPNTQQVYQYDYRSSTYNGTVIAWAFITKDFISPDKSLRLDSLTAYGIGNNVQVDISTDGGQTYVPMGVFNFGLSFTRQTINMQIVGNSLRFRFSGSDPTFQLDWYQIGYYEENEW